MCPGLTLPSRFVSRARGPETMIIYPSMPSHPDPIFLETLPCIQGRDGWMAPAGLGMGRRIRVPNPVVRSSTGLN